jgi:hypothetical protein
VLAVIWPNEYDHTWTLFPRVLRFKTRHSIGSSLSFLQAQGMLGLLEIGQLRKITCFDSYESPMAPFVFQFEATGHDFACTGLLSFHQRLLKESNIRLVDFKLSHGALRAVNKTLKSGQVSMLKLRLSFEGNTLEPTSNILLWPLLQAQTMRRSLTSGQASMTTPRLPTRPHRRQ